ncbi:hypothetical protein DPMN_172255 [Dreissena polymorpha]|uniref:Uncharacterized protein n=1 Tax=Dreissena polymorpha TaxID=45954 RepID=A0A9D4E2S1_DREPO|nr:hypothetical protein DPMN_172255 [Dreissena polymorpha]
MCHEDWTTHVTSRVLTSKIAPSTGGHPYRIKCPPPDIVTKNLLTNVNKPTKEQEHRLAGADRSSIFFLKVKGLSFSITKEGGCGVMTIAHNFFSKNRCAKNAPLPNAHVFQPTTNVLTKFHDDRTINVAS